MPNMQNSNPDAGYNWISTSTGIAPFQNFRTTSSIASVKTSSVINGITHNTYPKSYEPEPTLSAHLTFAMKYEGIDLDYLSRLFDHVGDEFIKQWLTDEPLSGYARRTGFFYEWLTGKKIDDIEDAGGNYVDAIDPDTYLVATVADKNRRWRINDNLPGSRDFCPMIEKDPALVDPAVLSSEITALLESFGIETIERAVRWLTIKESRASFVIESEGNEEDRIRRFARAMEVYCGKLDDPLSDESIEVIQKEIIGSVTTGFGTGIRKSPVFVGHSAGYSPVIDYLAPHFADVPELMRGLRVFEQRTRGQNPLLRASAISYGLVYIHPLSDGNGRISRFLVNEILRRDGVIPSPLILPVSATISQNAASRIAYDHSLERLSKPLMKRIEADCSFGAKTTYEDGVVSNLQFEEWHKALPTWQYPDLTNQSRYLTEVICSSIRIGLKDEAIYLECYDRAERGLKEILEGSSEDYAAIIRSIKQNSIVSGKLRKTYPLVFDDEARSARILKVVLVAFSLDSSDEYEDQVEPNTSVRPRPMN